MPSLADNELFCYQILSPTERDIRVHQAIGGSLTEICAMIADSAAEQDNLDWTQPL